jgi:hypothetical protein
VGIDAAATSSQASADQSNAQPASPDQSNLATAPVIPGAAAEQLNVLNQWKDGWLASVQSGESTMGSISAVKSTAATASTGKGASKDATVEATNDSSSMKPNAQSTTAQQGSQAGSPDAASSGNQGQNTAAVQANFASHAAVATAHAANTSDNTPAQAASTSARAAAHSGAGPDNAAPASASATTAQPVVNTAKLIQNIGQSEMHVGMRSTEFGSISINTSAAKDGISAQISVDHSELAKSLAAHLPEMQARLGSNQQMDVRIDMNGERAGQGAGTAGNGSNGSTDDARGSRRHAGNSTSSQSGSGYSEGSFQPVAAAGATGDGRYNSRLDIRV